MRMLVTAVVLCLSLASLSESASANPLDCSEGCTITTCDATHCTVYWCRAGDCKVIDRYRKDVVKIPPENALNSQRESNPAKSALGNAPGDLNCGQSLCLIRSCSDGQCTVYGFEDGESVELGVMEERDSNAHNWMNDFLDDLRDAKPEE